MTDVASSERQIRGAAPLFFVADVVKAAEHYSNVFGFTSPMLWGDPPGFAIPARDGVSVMLSQVDDRTLIRPHGAHHDTLDSFDAFFWVRDADSLFEEYKGKGADIVFAPVDRIYKMREFAVRDLDGYVLIFAHDISAPSGQS
jgi:uncharacterized glyoxalase superfamily protein PhnB